MPDYVKNDPMYRPVVGSPIKKDQDKGPFNLDNVKRYDKRRPRRNAPRSGGRR